MLDIAWEDSHNRYAYRTGEIEGYIYPGGKLMGVGSLVQKDQGKEWVATYAKGHAPYGIEPGSQLMVLDLYHFESREVPVGKMKGRDFSYEHCLDGKAIISNLRSPEEFGIECSVRWEILEGGIDMALEVRTDRPYQDLDVWIASYLDGRATSSPYVCVIDPAKPGNHRFVRVEEVPLVEGLYVCYPRDRASAALTYDGRWAGAVMGPPYHHPLTVSIDRATGCAYVQMHQRESCSRLFVSYACEIPEKDYTAIFSLLFGRDFEPGVSQRARVRACAAKMGEGFGVPLALYEEFAKASELDQCGTCE